MAHPTVDLAQYGKENFWDPILTWPQWPVTRQDQTRLDRTGPDDSITDYDAYAHYGDYDDNDNCGDYDDYNDYDNYGKEYDT